MALRAIDFDDSPLDDLERELVRQILGIDGRAGSAIYVESETRMDGLTSPQNQLVRLVLEDADEIGIDTTKVKGGSKGADIDPERDESKAAKLLRRMLYPSARNNDPLNFINPPTLGQLQFIAAQYEIGTQSEFD
jgi:hypothetical protein